LDGHGLLHATELQDRATFLSGTNAWAPCFDVERCYSMQLALLESSQTVGDMLDVELLLTPLALLASYSRACCPFVLLARAALL
jgi:hypothetical protein